MWCHRSRPSMAFSSLGPQYDPWWATLAGQNFDVVGERWQGGGWIPRGRRDNDGHSDNGN